MEKENKKTNRWPIVLLVIVLLLAGGGYFVYTNGYLLFFSSNVSVEETIPETETKPIASDKPSTPTDIPDYSDIDGHWKSEATEEGRFLEFTARYPEVKNFNGISGKLEKINNYRFTYRLTFTDEEGTSVFYISDLQENSALVWYEDENGQYSNSLKLNRDPENAPAVVSQEQTGSSTQNAPTGSGQTVSPSSGNDSSGSESNSGKGHYEERQVLVQEAYDEQVLVKKGECTQVLVQDAYDTEEMVYLDGAYYGPDTEERAWCYICEHFYDDHCHQQAHPSNNKTVEISEPYWHNVEYRTVHHDAVYETRCEPDEYKTVHHDAVYETRRVWVED